MPEQGYAENRRPTNGVSYLDGPRRAHQRRSRRARSTPAGVCRYRLEFQPPWAGTLEYEVRAVPDHPHLSHPLRARLDAQALSDRSSNASKLAVRAGSRQPLGATAQDDGVNFAVFSPRATQVWLRLYRVAGGPRADRGDRARRGGASHATGSGTCSSPARAPAGSTRGAPTGPTSRRRACASTRSASCSTRGPGSSATRFGIATAAIDGDVRAALRAEIAAADDYDWEGDRPLRRSLQDAVIYELHVGGFTRHPSAGVAAPRHVPRPHRQDSVPAGARHHRRRAVARVRVRHAGRAGRDGSASACTISGATAP